VDALGVALGVRADGAGLARRGHEGHVIAGSLVVGLLGARGARGVRLLVVVAVGVLVLEAGLIVAVGAHVAVVGSGTPLDVGAVRGGEAAVAGVAGVVGLGGGVRVRRHENYITDVPGTTQGGRPSPFG
jgi:hypothetical protein